MEKVAILAITKNGIEIGLSLKKKFCAWKIYAPSKFSNQNLQIDWFDDSTGVKIEELFKTNEALVCIFSLGAVIRLIAPHMKDKKTDPAVVVIDDTAKFAISALSGHIGGANHLTEEIAKVLNASAVITTAADVNKTIAVDLVGKEFGWQIEDDSTVTKISAFMINEEKIGVFQNVGEKNWWAPKKELPKNVTIYDSFEVMRNSDCRGYLIISDRIIDDEQVLKKAVIYRPKTLVVGVGLHRDTTSNTIKEGLDFCSKNFKLSIKSIARFASIRKESQVEGLQVIAKELNVPVDYYEKEELAKITIPNPSGTVEALEGIPSVSEAASLLSSNGELVVEKQKFPPNLTIAISRILK